MKIVLTDPLREDPLFRLMLDFFSKSYKPKTFNALGLAERFMIEHSSEDESVILFNPPLWPEDVLIGKKSIPLNLYNHLGSFLMELKGLAAVKYVKNNRGYKRMAIPPLSAFDYISHNKINVTDSGLTAAILHG